MKRSFERKTIYIASVWQLLTGMITIFYYSFYIRGQASQLGNLSPVESMGVQSIFKNLYMFSVTYGLFFVVIAIVNTLFTWKMMKDHTLQYKIPFIWLGLAAIFFFLSDFISVMFYVSAGVIALAKNRVLKLNHSASNEMLSSSK